MIAQTTEDRKLLFEPKLKRAGSDMTMQIFDPLNYACTPHSFAFMAVGAATSVLGIYVMVRERRSGVGTTFWLFTVCISTWLLSFGTAYASRAGSSAYRWFQLSQVAVTFIPAAVFALTAAIVRRQRQLRRLIWTCIAASSLFCLLDIFTRLHVAGLYRYYWGYYPKYGPSGMVFLAYFFSVMISVVMLYYKAYRQAGHPRHRQRMKGMLMAFGIGYLASLDFLAAMGIPLYAFGYLPMTAFLIITARVILRYRLVDITPALIAGRILETMHGAVIVTDAEGIIRIANRSAYAMLGYDPPELIGRELPTVIEAPQAWTDKRMLRERTTQSSELIWTGKSGQSVHVSVSTSLITDRDGSVAGTAYVASDITERKKAEERLKQFSEELKDVNEEMKNFAYIVSHDLRAPLVSIKGFSSELEYTVRDIRSLIEKYLQVMDAEDRRKLEVFLNEDLGQALKFIGFSVTRMDSLINAVLSLSRIGRREIKLERIDMNAVTRNILNSLAHQIEERQVQIKVANLPEITADTLTAEQIIGNILDNALKYLDPLRRGELNIFSEERDGETVFHIRDNGRGIEKEDIPKVFEIFRRLGAQDVPGEGMGLAYVKTLVRRHGGRIWCESELGKGSVFSFTIPHAELEVKK